MNRNNYFSAPDEYAEDLKNNEVFPIIAGVGVARVVIETPILYPTKRKQHKDVQKKRLKYKQM